MVLVDSHGISPVPWYSGTLLDQLPYAYRTVTCYGAAFQTASASARGLLCRPYNPDVTEITSVWAPPRSLATTWGITVVFSSSRYLDVSVPWVGFCVPMYSARDDPASRGRVFPFGDPRIYACLQLLAAYRSLSRPSSPIHAKASTKRSYLLKPYGSTHIGRSIRRSFFGDAIDASTLTTRRRSRQSIEAYSTEFHHVKERLWMLGRPFFGSDVLETELVELGGFEPPTPCLQSRCSTN